MGSQVIKHSEEAFPTAISYGCLRNAKHISSDEEMLEAANNSESFIAVFGRNNAVMQHIMGLMEDVLHGAGVLVSILYASREMKLLSGARVKYITCSPNDERLRGYAFTHYRTF